jgi:hypothetical protein
MPDRHAEPERLFGQLQGRRNSGCQSDEVNDKVLA